MTRFTVIMLSIIMGTALLIILIDLFRGNKDE